VTPDPEPSPLPAPAGAAPFPILRVPAAPGIPVLVSIPHYGTDSVPGVCEDDYREARYRGLRYGYTDPFAREIYGRVHERGATLLATPYSRLFVDLNRARDDFTLDGGAVRSQRGVIRTHLRGDAPLFRRGLCAASAERQLACYYDPYHHALRGELDRLRRAFRHAVLLDAHTASAPRMAEHEVVIGTRRGATCSPALAEGLAVIVRGHGFRCRFDVPGYAGGHIVRSHGRRDGAVQAVQLEFNALRLLGTNRHDFVAARRRGAPPPHDPGALARCVACVHEALDWLARWRPH